MTRKDLTGVFFLFFLAMITAFFYHYISSPGIALFGQWEPSKGVVTAMANNDAVDSLIEINDPEIIRQMVQKNQRIILDVRPREIYDQGHLPHAVSFPLMDFDEDLPRLLNSIHRQSALLVYCASVECTDSHTVAERLNKLRYENVRVFAGGFRQWQEKGYEIEKNEEE